MQAIQNHVAVPLSQLEVKSSEAWKTPFLVSAVALAAIACFVQALLGSFSVSLVYGFLGAASYLGYTAQQKIFCSQRKEEYYGLVHQNMESLRENCLSFRKENKIMAETNQSLKEQVEEIKNLLATTSSSANLTKDLLGRLRSMLDRITEEEGSLIYLKKLTPLVLGLLKKPELFQKLSLKEKEDFHTLQKNWQVLTTFPT